ncbi:MAG: hypothetical protein JWR85_1755 [Marmoricola sp.]|jgi:uncharacterized membrane protein YoaK (UPF0700 family)|nr:hypothetical protein [Marmoricola sp.]
MQLPWKVSRDAGAIQLRDHLIMALALSAGATDAICFLALAGKFSAFMTGNLVFLGIGIAGAGAPGSPLHTVLSPLVGFAVGVMVATPLLNPIRGPKSWPRCVTPALALTALTQLCFLGLWLSVSGHPSVLLTDVMLAVSAVGMGIQTVAVLALGIYGVFTTAATATLTVLMGSATPHWSKQQPDERVLAGTLIGVVGGAVVGAVLEAHALIWAPLLPLLVTSSVVVIAAIAFKDTQAGSPHSRLEGASS